MCAHMNIRLAARCGGRELATAARLHALGSKYSCIQQWFLAYGFGQPIYCPYSNREAVFLLDATYASTRWQRCGITGAAHAARARATQGHLQCESHYGAGRHLCSFRAARMGVPPH
jgi:hypothetical protein